MKLTFVFIFLIYCLLSFGQQTDTSSSIIEVSIKNYNQKQEATFPGGSSELIKYIFEHAQYPDSARINNIEGIVYVRTQITKTGDIGELKIMRKIDPLLEKEAIRVIKSMPRWYPAKENGEPIDTWFILPVKFKL